MAGEYVYNLAGEETYKDGQTVIREGSPGDWVYVILSGSVEISKAIRGKKCIVEVLQTGEVFGELGFIGGMKRTATACAVGETTLGIIDRGFLEEEYNRLSGQFRSILETVTRRFQKILERLYDQGGRTEPRVPKVLSLTYKERGAFINAYTDNASNGGLFIKTEKPLEVGFQFILRLQLPGVPNPLQIKSEVRWARPPEKAQPDQSPGMGIQFLEISENDTRVMKECLSAPGQDK
ncbi:MAG: TIGR02266 family protein [Deltaproteobacteria bacterium]|nr:TIGR02266 family protein [Deltaproteobacteria bacterium]